MINETKNAKIRNIYGIAFLALTVLLGVAFILRALTLHNGGGYTEAGTKEKLTEMILPSVAWAACLIVGIAIYGMFPVAKEKPKGGVNLAAQLKRAVARLPEDAWQQDARELKKKSVVTWMVAAAVVLISFVFPLCYLLNPKNFNHTDANVEMFEAAKHTLPFVAVAFAAVIVAYVLQMRYLRAAVAVVKAKTAEAAKAGLLRKADGEKKGLKEGWLDCQKNLWIVRGVLIAIALFLIVFGVANGGLENVFYKAANLCMECVGLA